VPAVQYFTRTVKHSNFSSLLGFHGQIWAFMDKYVLSHLSHRRFTASQYLKEGNRSVRARPECDFLQGGFIHVHAYICTHIFIHIYKYIKIYIDIDMHIPEQRAPAPSLACLLLVASAFPRIDAYIYIHQCMYIYIYLYIHACICICVYVYMYIRICKFSSGTRLRQDSASFVNPPPLYMCCVTGFL